MRRKVGTVSLSLALLLPTLAGSQQESDVVAATSSQTHVLSAETVRSVAALDQPSKLLSALPYVDVVGYLQWPGGLEHSVRYVRQTARPDGGSDIVMVVERPLWLWWDPTAKWAADQQFTVVQMRVSKDGTGEGRIATGGGFRRDSDSGIVISDTTKPTLLTDVRRESVK